MLSKFNIAYVKNAILKKFIIKPLMVFRTLLEYEKFFFIKTKSSWCKCRLSAPVGEFLFIIFLIIENKFSYAGYHNIHATKYGDTASFVLEKLIKKYPKTNEIR